MIGILFVAGIVGLIINGLYGMVVSMGLTFLIYGCLSLVIHFASKE